MELTLTNKVALVTGATSGIGEATAREFLKSGANVFLTGRNSEKLKTIQKEFNHVPEKIDFMAGNITDLDFQKRLLERTIQTFGKLDILVNAAGIINSGTIESTSLEQFDHMMNVNLRSIFHLMQIAIPFLEKTGGNIVNVSSVAGLRSFPGILAYSVSKAAVDQLTRCAALELAPKHIRVNAVNPGVVRTQLHLRSAMSPEQYQQFLEHSKTTHPLGRVGTPEEIAALITYLASEAASWITGATYSIDGGRNLTCAR